MCNLFQLSSKVLLYPELSEIIDRIVTILEVRSAATANSFINPRYTISSVFRDLLTPLKLLTKISKSKKLFLPRIFVKTALAEKSVKQTFNLNEPIMCVFFVPRENQ